MKKKLFVFCVSRFCINYLLLVNCTLGCTLEAALCTSEKLDVNDEQLLSLHSWFIVGTWLVKN